MKDIYRSRGLWITLVPLIMVVAVVAAAQLPTGGAAAPPEPGLESQWESIAQAIRRIPLAAALGAILAFRPRRRGTPARTTAVIQTQIILSLIHISEPRDTERSRMPSSA